MRVTLLASGSNGNCCLVEDGPVRALIDVGLGPRLLRSRLSLAGVAVADLTHVVLTHAHHDHISGIAALCTRRTDLEVLATAPTISALPDEVQGQARPLAAGRTYSLGPLDVTPFRLLHDAHGTVGFRIQASAGVLAYATDFGQPDDGVVEALRGASLLVVESNHDDRMLAAGPYPAYLKRRIAGPYGHLSNEGCRALLDRVVHDGLRHVVLAHLSEVNNSEAAVVAALEPLTRSATGVSFAIGSRRGALPPIVLSPAPPLRPSRRGRQLELRL